MRSRRRLIERQEAMEVKGRRSISCITADLLPKIFCRLPVDKILQLRSVCKLWNSIISSAYTCPSLWSPLSPVPYRLPWIITCSTFDSILAIDPSCRRLLTIPICRPASSISCPFCCLAPCGFFRLAASCAGLLCFATTCPFANPHRYGCLSQHLFVCNPITKACKVLPELWLRGTPFVHTMYVDECSGHYMVFIATDDDSSGSSGEVGSENVSRDDCDDFPATHPAVYYSSADAKWHRLKNMECMQMNDREGTLFSSLKLADSWTRLYKVITMYNTGTQVVTNVQFDMASSISLREPGMICRGDVVHRKGFLVGGFGKYKLSNYDLWENKMVQVSIKFLEAERQFSLLANSEKDFSDRPRSSFSLDAEALFIHHRRQDSLYTALCDPDPANFTWLTMPVCNVATCMPGNTFIIFSYGRKRF